MCLAIPGKILETDSSSQPAMGTVSFAGIQKRVCLEWVPEAKVGDYVLVHVGFALHTIDEKEALATLELLAEMGALNDELSSGPAAGGDGSADSEGSHEAKPRIRRSP